MNNSGFPGIPVYDEASTKYKIVKETMNDGTAVDVIYRKGSPGKTREEMDALRAKGERVDDFSFCAPLNPRVYEAASGIMCMQDKCVVLRDGVKIYADIYLPKNAAGPVPLIVCWWFSGKRQAEGADDWIVEGCPPDTVSKLAKFESAVRHIGAERAMLLPMLIQGASATQKATSAASASRTEGTGMTSSSGPPGRTGATAISACSVTPASPW